MTGAARRAHAEIELASEPDPSPAPDARSEPAGTSARWRDTVAVATLALVVRAALIGWAAGRFPPTADGLFYHRIAERIGNGLGYTWLWPDGVVTCPTCRWRKNAFATSNLTCVTRPPSSKKPT